MQGVYVKSSCPTVRKNRKIKGFDLVIRTPFEEDYSNVMEIEGDGEDLEFNELENLNISVSLSNDGVISVDNFVRAQHNDVQLHQLISEGRLKVKHIEGIKCMKVHSTRTALTSKGVLPIIPTLLLKWYCLHLHFDNFTSTFLHLRS